MSDRLVVIAPGKGSGALITAEYMKAYGREVEIINDMSYIAKEHK